MDTLWKVGPAAVARGEEAEARGGGMADANAVYEQFLLTPLKLKLQPRAEDRDDDPGGEDGVAAALGFDLASETDEEERGDSRRPVHASPELERLRGRIESADLEGDECAAAASSRAMRRGSDAKAGARAEAEADAVALALDSRRRAQKKKRVTRAVTMQSGARSGGEWVDTPTKASRPPKRSRRQAGRADTDKENRDDATDSAAALALLSRHISDSFGDMDDGEAGERAEQEDGAATSSSSTSLSSSPPPVAALSSKSKDVTSSVATRSVRRSRRLAHQLSDQESGVLSPPTAADVLTPLCEALIATNTVSGLLFALSLNALRSLGRSAVCPVPVSSLEAANAASTATPTPTTTANPFQAVYNICWGIAQCEQLTQQQLKLPTVQLSPKRRHDASARALEKVLAATRTATKSPVQPKTSKKEKKKKKSVRFRSFDLSCLSLQYVESEHVAAMVDRMIASYGKLMDYVSSTLKRSQQGEAAPHGPTLSTLRELADVMGSESRLLQPGMRSADTYEVDAAGVPGQESADAARIVEAAFSSRDSMTQHEIRLAGAFFAQQFERLTPSASPASVPSPARPTTFLHEMFSPLISSAVRYKLRLIFLHSTIKEEQTDAGGESEADGDCLTAADTTPAALAAATYTHQDVGAAIHRALQESLLYLPLVSPMLEQLDDEHEDDRIDAVIEQLKQRSVDEVERVDQFILARRFLRYHLPRALDPQSPSSELTSGIWREVERICSIAQRLDFEDEAHLFPLASARTLNDLLASEDARLERLDRAVQAFWEAQDGYEASRANGLQECAECRAVISRAEASVSIACTLCASRFHLKCLHLPDSFAQFAAHYTCPACFLGRSRMEY